MDIEFSAHSLEQLRIRKRISKQMVRQAVKLPDTMGRSYRGRKLYKKNYENEILEVVGVIEDNKVVIITQYFLEQ